MYTSQGSGDILVRMWVSWENFVVDLHTFRRILKQVKQFVSPIFAFLRLNTTFPTFLMLKCI